MHDTETRKYVHNETLKYVHNGESVPLLSCVLYHVKLKDYFENYIRIMYVLIQGMLLLENKLASHFKVNHG